MKKTAVPFIEVWDLLTKVQTLINMLSRRVHTRSNLTAQELRVMLELDRTKTINISELSNIIDRDFGNVSRTCSGLVEKGFLRRQRADGDKRVILVALTAQGKQKLDVFYEYNLILAQSKALNKDRDKYDAMMKGINLFISFIAEGMEGLND